LAVYLIIHDTVLASKQLKTDKFLQRKQLKHGSTVITLVMIVLEFVLFFRLPSLTNTPPDLLVAASPFSNKVTISTCPYSLPYNLG